MSLMDPLYEQALDALTKLDQVMEAGQVALADTESLLTVATGMDRVQLETSRAALAGTLAMYPADALATVRAWLASRR